MKSFIWNVFHVCLLILQTATAQAGNGSTVAQTVISYSSLYNGTDLAQNIILIGSDYLEAFYSKLCDKETYYYKLAFLENGLYFATESSSISKQHLDPSKYSDLYQCQGHYLILNCTRMLQTSQCGSGSVILHAQYNFPNDFCNKTSVPLCVLQRQRMSIAMNITQPVTQVEVTTHKITTHSQTRTNGNVGTRNGPNENSLILLIITAVFSLLSHSITDS